MNIRKVLLLLFIVLIVLIPIIIFVLSTNKKSETDVASDAPQEKEISCLEDVGNVLPGLWQHGENVASDYPARVTLLLDDTGTFQYRVAEINGDRNYTLAGTWKYDETNVALDLQFEELNDSWREILSEPDLRSTNAGVVEYNLENRSITVRLNYMMQGGGGKCDAGRYYIDMLNIYLYRVVES